jgi:hypothetical protein
MKTNEDEWGRVKKKYFKLWARFRNRADKKTLDIEKRAVSVEMKIELVQIEYIEELGEFRRSRL